jgi:hypothetical protein
MRKAIICGVCVAALAGTAVRLELRNRVPWNSVLEINLSGEMEGQRGVSGASVIPANSSSDAVTESDLARAIDAARDDKRVGGLVLRIGNAGVGGSEHVATDISWELAAHIAAFRKSGRAAVCVGAEEDGDGVGVIAAACDLWLSKGVITDEDVDDYFDTKFGEDNWSAIEVRDYLKKARRGGWRVRANRSKH